MSPDKARNYMLPGLWVRTERTNGNFDLSIQEGEIYVTNGRQSALVASADEISKEEFGAYGPRLDQFIEGVAK